MGRSDLQVAASVSCFSSLTGLEELIIDSSRKFSSDSLICDEQTSELHPSFAMALPHLLSLRSLSLTSCYLTPKGMTSLAPILSQLVDLRSLHISFDPHLDSAGAESLCSALSKLPHLQSLRLFYCTIRDPGFSSLASILRFLPQLTAIDLSFSSGYATSIDQGMISLSKELPLCCPLLQSLSVGCNDFTPAAIHAFFAALPLLPSLRELEIPAISVEYHFADFLTVIPSLAPGIEILHLNNNKLDLKQWTELAALLPLFSRIQKLLLVSIHLNPQLFRVISPALSRLPSLAFLNIACNEIGVGRQGANSASASAHPSAVAVAQMLPSLLSLRELNLSFCEFDSADFLIIVKQFHHLSSLHRLTLAGLYLTDPVVEPLLTALLPIRDLHFLDLTPHPHLIHFIDNASIRSRVRSVLQARFPFLNMLLKTKY